MFAAVLLAYLACVNADHIVEGDILVSDDASSLAYSTTGSVDISYWDNGIVPYYIDGSVVPRIRGLVHAAMNDIADKTCLKFKLHTNEDYYIKVIPANGCYSHLGKNKPTTIGLNAWCNQAQVYHELGHALGFIHEVNRNDRDSYIKIYRQNIPDENFHLFKKTNYAVYESYDYLSIMHYKTTDFAKRGKKSISALDEKDNNLIDQDKDSMSNGDIAKLRKIYKC